MEERFLLAINRIEEIKDEHILPERIQSFFSSEAEFVLYLKKIYDKAADGELCKLTYEELKADNSYVYEHSIDITYDNAQSDDEVYLCALDAELRAMIPCAYEGDLWGMVIRVELFLEIYTSYLCAMEDGAGAPDITSLKEIFFYYVSDYTEEATEKKVRNMLTLDEDFATAILKNNDFKDVKDLYLYGEYVTEVEERTLEHLNSIPYEKLKLMADTFTGGYCKGFELMGVDLSTKKNVNIRYSLGFEPVIKLAIENFEKIGLKSTITRASFDLLNGRGVVRNGYQGACPSRQYDFEHKEDAALFFDPRLKKINLESRKKAFKKYKYEASVYAGPAVMEVFGEKAPEYRIVPAAPAYSEDQQKLTVEMTGELMMIQNEYINEEERSFTIIAFPTPNIGKDFEGIFDEVIKLNTLDYVLYRDTQQKIIDALDKGTHVIVKGKGDNKTDLRISLHKLDDPGKETIFENCVADVNIPVGEVFTTPVLKGTEGTLYVKRVFLNGLEYKDFMLTISDGMITSYSCSGFPTLEENLSYIRDNFLFRHESLPMGEFAIGTNTTAYRMARRYGIEDVLPILIAEKTGPHFAFGDSCYSHCEEVRVYNPDGKEIVAKENEKSLLRSSELSKAYFNCHTDVTIPFDDIAVIKVVDDDGNETEIIRDGRFVLPGTEVLNEALD
ncbi:MAG: aminopeptidase [Lachnospiraceae bacterium]|nr:aminopeptidase [Lachnospiraceae bacterium]